jgi:hypothetical protein
VPPVAYAQGLRGAGKLQLLLKSMESQKQNLSLTKARPPSRGHSPPLLYSYNTITLEVITMAFLFVLFILFMVFYVGLGLLIYNTITIPMMRHMYRRITKDKD